MPRKITQDEPIAAIATTVGESAVAIVRMSGDNVLEIGDKVFQKANDKDFSFQNAPTHTAHYGSIIRETRVVDEVIAIVFKSPKSYTKEDIIEINCHGGALVTEEVLRTLLDAGCRLAQPGEFTKRAFLNGRLDLSQAEAIGELIHAKTNAAHQSAIAHLKGDLSKRLSELRGELLKGCALLELEFDFSEEDVEFQNREELKNLIGNFISEVETLLTSFQTSKVLKEGLKVALVGKPNVGKSTLLNALVGSERAIVSDIEGTTRDYLQEPFTYDGMLFQFVDTAGLRESQHEVEAEGIRRSIEQGQEAQVVAFLFDASMPKSNQKKELDNIKRTFPNAKIIAIGNKIDLVKSGVMDGVSALVPTTFISASKRINTDSVYRLLKEVSTDILSRQDGSVVITNLRHYEALKEALAALKDARDMLKTNENLELVASALRSALHSVASITGEVVTDDVLDYIFSKFCIGK